MYITSRLDIQRSHPCNTFVGSSLEIVQGFFVKAFGCTPSDSMPNLTTGLLDEDLGESCSADQYVDNVDEGWFSSLTAFLIAMRSPMRVPEGLTDSARLRTILIFISYGVVARPLECARRGCKCKPVLDVLQGRYHWTCPKGKRVHMQESVIGLGVLRHVRISSWPTFLMMVVLLRLRESWRRTVEEVESAYGSLGKDTLLRFRRYFQESLRVRLVDTNALMIGGNKMWVVIDETVIGVYNGFKKKVQGLPQRSDDAKSASKRFRSQKHIARKLPARTIHKKPARKLKHATLHKKPAASGRRMLKRPAANKKSNGMWLWVGVTVGHGSQVLTHGAGTKQVTFRLLPPREEALAGKPRGVESISDTLKKHVRTSTKLVFDKWLGTVAAARRLGYHFPPPVNHSLCFRDSKTGFHSNDVESENQRIKSFLRARYGVLKLGRYKKLDNDTVLDLYEYVYRVNVGETMEDFMDAMAKASYDDIVDQLAA
jgi:hypothetical protein